jgi:hypothetical protein
MNSSVSRWVLVSCFVGMGLGAFGFEGVAPGDPSFDLQQRVFGLVAAYWRDVDALHGEGSLPESDFAARSAVLATELAQAIRTNDESSLRLVGEIYRTLPEPGRAPLQDVISRAQGQLAHDDPTCARVRALRAYFPGYGYSEPGYKYRKGLEIKREIRGTSWQEEEHTHTTNKSLNLTISVDLLGMLRKLATGGLIRNLIIGEPYQPSYDGGNYFPYPGNNGSTGFMVNVSFSTAKTITTKVRRKYEVCRVWFELQRAPAAGWGNVGDWAACGQTYEIIQDPTGDEYVVQLDPVDAAGNPVPPPVDPAS